MVGPWADVDRASDSYWEASRLSGMQDLRWCGALAFVSLVIRWVTLYQTRVISNDGPTFIRIAQDIVAGNWMEAFAQPQHPGYPILMAGGHVLLGDLFVSGQWISLIGGSLAVVALYCFLVQAWNRRIAVVGALLLALNPYAARLSADVQTDAVYLFLFLSSIALLYAALRERREAWSFGVGLLSGLAYWVRPEGVGVILLGVVFAGVAWLRGGWATGRVLTWVLALLVGAVSMMAPYLFALARVTQSFTFSQKKSVPLMLGLVGPDGPNQGGLDLSEQFGIEEWVGVGLAVALILVLMLFWLRRIQLARVRIGPVALFSLVLACLILLLVLVPSAVGVLAAAFVSTLRPEILLLVFIGVVSRSSRDPSARTFFVLMVLGFYGLVLLGLFLSYGYVVRRYVLPPVALLLGYASAGAWVLIGRLEQGLVGRGFSSRRAAWGAFVVVLAIVVLIALPKTWRNHRSEQMAARRAAEWIGAQATGPGRLASSRFKYAWYAQREWWPLVIAGEDLSAAALYKGGVRWILIESYDPEEEIGQEFLSSPAHTFEVLERYRVHQGLTRAVVWELSPIRG